MRTSLSHPLQIAEVRPFDGAGLIGITFLPGKKQSHAATGAWHRDLALDLDAVAAWNAAAVLTLVEHHELATYEVPSLGAEVEARHMPWYHAPIPDQGIPDAGFEEVWGGLAPGLHDRLRNGANVVVHCRGGLGRAGTIAARLMVELGVPHTEAVAQVRSVRPGAIENTRQLNHVMGLRALPEVEADRGPEATRDRAIGALLGLAIGDALGTTLEFSRRDSKPQVRDLVGGGPFRLQPGQWTDDTAMAVALATSLIDRRGLDEADLMERFVAWHEEGEFSCTGTCFDIGITVRQALDRYKRSGDPMAGSTDPMSAGNGSLMRLSPVAIRFWQDRTKLRDVAARQSRTTHGAPEAVDACVAFAEVLADAIAGHPRSQVLRPRPQAWAGNIGPIMAGAWRGRHRDTINSSGYVAHSLEAALWCVGRTGSFAEAVILAANLGDDSDTVAAITGQLAGALYGKEGIPQEWLAKLAWAMPLEALALELTTPWGWYPG